MFQGWLGGFEVIVSSIKAHGNINNDFGVNWRLWSNLEQLWSSLISGCSAERNNLPVVCEWLTMISSPREAQLPLSSHPHTHEKAIMKSLSRSIGRSAVSFNFKVTQRSWDRNVAEIGGAQKNARRGPSVLVDCEEIKSGGVKFDLRRARSGSQSLATGPGWIIFRVVSGHRLLVVDQIATITWLNRFTGHWTGSLDNSICV